MTWSDRWDVPRSDGSGVWTVSRSDAGAWGCSCPVWRFKRETCKHITRIQEEESSGIAHPRLELVCANVPQVTREDARVLVPLLPIGDTHFQATLCFDLYACGVPWSEVRERYRLDQTWTKQAVLAYVLKHGRKYYADTARKGRKEYVIDQNIPLPDIPKYRETPDAYSRRLGYPLDLATLLLGSVWAESH